MIRSLSPIRRLEWMSIVFALFVFAGTGSAEEIPRWVEGGGSSEAFQPDRYLTGFGKAEGKQDALESAKQQATSDLARQISVQIESNVVDITRESNGRYENDLTSQIRATSDIRIEGIRFETFRKKKSGHSNTKRSRRRCETIRSIVPPRSLPESDPAAQQATPTLRPTSQAPRSYTRDGRRSRARHLQPESRQ